jgi:hypothetical protein
MAITKETTPTLSSLKIEEVPEVKSTSNESNEPELTQEKALAVLEDLADVEAANGHVAIAQKHDLTRDQVAELHQEMLAAQEVELSE